MTIDATNSALHYLDMLICDWPVKAICTCLVSILSWFVGGLDTLVNTMFMLMALDFLLGFSRAWKDERISGQKMKEGAVKFIIYVLSVWTVVLLQAAVTAFDPTVLGVKMSVAIRDWVVVYLILNETISCADHLVCLGVPLPQGLIKRLKRYRKKLNDYDGPNRRTRKNREGD